MHVVPHLERSLCALVECLLLGVLDDSWVGAEEDGVVGGAADDPDREVRRLVELTHRAVPGGKWSPGAEGGECA